MVRGDGQFNGQLLSENFLYQQFCSNFVGAVSNVPPANTARTFHSAQILPVIRNFHIKRLRTPPQANPNGVSPRMFNSIVLPTPAQCDTPSGRDHPSRIRSGLIHHITPSDLFHRAVYKTL